MHCLGFCLVAWASPIAAQEQDELSGLSQEQLQAGYDRLFQDMLRDPANLDLMFNFAKTAIALNNFEAAIGTLERMLIINQDLPRVKLELGVLYFRLRSYAVARSYLLRSIEGPEVPEAVQERVAIFLEEIDRLEATSVFTATVQFGIRTQSNANAGPASEQVRAGGNEALLDDAFLEEEDQSMFGLVFVRHNYDLGTQFNESWETTFLGYLSRQFDLTALDSDIYEVTTGPRLSLGSAELGPLFSDAFVRPYVIGNMVRLNDERLYHSFGAGLSYDMAKGDFFTSFDYRLTQRQFNNTDDLPNASDRDGLEHDAGLFIDYYPNGWLKVRGLAGFLHDDADENYETRNQYRLGGSLTFRYDAPFIDSNLPWDFTLGARRIWTNYDEADPAVDPDTSRQDREWRFQAVQEFRVTPRASIIAELQHREIDSNLPNFEFDDTSGSLSFAYQF